MERKDNRIFSHLEMFPKTEGGRLNEVAKKTNTDVVFSSTMKKKQPRIEINSKSILPVTTAKAKAAHSTDTLSKLALKKLHKMEKEAAENRALVGEVNERVDKLLQDYEKDFATNPTPKQKGTSNMPLDLSDNAIEERTRARKAVDASLGGLISRTNDLGNEVPQNVDLNIKIDRDLRKIKSSKETLNNVTQKVLDFAKIQERQTGETISELQKELSGKCAEIESLKEDIGNKDKTIKEMNSLVVSLKTASRMLNSRVDRLKSKVNEESKVREESEQLLQRERRQSAHKLLNMEHELDKADNDANKSAEKLREELQAMRAQRKNLRIALRESATKVEDLMKQVAEITAQLNLAQSNLKTQTEKYDEEISELQENMQKERQLMTESHEKQLNSVKQDHKKELYSERESLTFRAKQSEQDSSRRMSMMTTKVDDLIEKLRQATRDSEKTAVKHAEEKAKLLSQLESEEKAHAETRKKASNRSLTNVATLLKKKVKKHAKLDIKKLSDEGKDITSALQEQLQKVEETVEEQEIIIRDLKFQIQSNKNDIEEIELQHEKVLDRTKNTYEESHKIELRQTRVKLEEKMEIIKRKSEQAIRKDKEVLDKALKNSKRLIAQVNALKKENATLHKAATILSSAPPPEYSPKPSKSDEEKSSQSESDNALKTDIKNEKLEEIDIDEDFVKLVNDKEDPLNRTNGIDGVLTEDPIHEESDDDDDDDPRIFAQALEIDELKTEIKELKQKLKEEKEEKKQATTNHHHLHKESLSSLSIGTTRTLTVDIDTQMTPRDIDSAISFNGLSSIESAPTPIIDVETPSNRPPTGFNLHFSSRLNSSRSDHDGEESHDNNNNNETKECGNNNNNNKTISHNQQDANEPLIETDEEHLPISESNSTVVSMRTDQIIEDSLTTTESEVDKNTDKKGSTLLNAFPKHSDTPSHSPKEDGSSRNDDSVENEEEKDNDNERTIEQKKSFLGLSSEDDSDNTTNGSGNANMDAASLVASTIPPVDIDEQVAALHSTKDNQMKEMESPLCGSVPSSSPPSQPEVKNNPPAQISNILPPSPPASIPTLPPNTPIVNDDSRLINALERISALEEELIATNQREEVHRERLMESMQLMHQLEEALQTTMMASEEKQMGTLLFHAFLKRPGYAVDTLNQLYRQIQDCRLMAQGGSARMDKLISKVITLSTTSLPWIQEIKSSYNKTYRLWSRGRRNVKNASKRLIDEYVLKKDCFGDCPICMGPAPTFGPLASPLMDYSEKDMISMRQTISPKASLKIQNADKSNEAAQKATMMSSTMNGSLNTINPTPIATRTSKKRARSISPIVSSGTAVKKKLFESAVVPSPKFYIGSSTNPTASMNSENSSNHNVSPFQIDDEGISEEYLRILQTRENGHPFLNPHPTRISSDIDDSEFSDPEDCEVSKDISEGKRRIVESEDSIHETVEAATSSALGQNAGEVLQLLGGATSQVGHYQVEGNNVAHVTGHGPYTVKRVLNPTKRKTVSDRQKRANKVKTMLIKRMKRRKKVNVNVPSYFAVDQVVEEEALGTPNSHNHQQQQRRNSILNGEIDMLMINASATTTNSKDGKSTNSLDGSTMHNKVKGKVRARKHGEVIKNFLEESKSVGRLSSPIIYDHNNKPNTRYQLPSKSATATTTTKRVGTSYSVKSLASLQDQQSYRVPSPLVTESQINDAFSSTQQTVVFTDESAVVSVPLSPSTSTSSSAFPFPDQNETETGTSKDGNSFLPAVQSKFQQGGFTPSVVIHNNNSGGKSNNGNINGSNGPMTTVSGNVMTTTIAGHEGSRMRSRHNNKANHYNSRFSESVHTKSVSEVMIGLDGDDSTIDRDPPLVLPRLGSGHRVESSRFMPDAELTRSKSQYPQRGFTFSKQIRGSELSV
eukprot:TRINITY_DN3174_c0_g1_i1.p1 TRINITY_DN3174_c0_g1~~TRINITY_DN3174_c0_g1_i1.p1  ORF type:complete len:1884 (-),score=586.39 TRINITY_DN3174_c0_g1_i1:122-5773(-)